MTELRAELDAANKKVAELTSEVNRLYQYRYRSESQIALANVEINPQNNVLREDKKAIRSIKKSATSISRLWKSLKPYAARYHKFNDRRDMAIGAMLVVGAFYDYGNPFPNDEKDGCVSINQNTNYQSIGDLTFEAMKKSDIGCCTDYTLMLISFLRHLGYEVEAVNNGGHQMPKVTIDGHQSLLDANTLIYAQDYFSEAKTTLYYFTPFARSRTQQFQQYVLTSLAFGLEKFRPNDWYVSKPGEHAENFRAYFLADDANRSSN